MKPARTALGLPLTEHPYCDSGARTRAALSAIEAADSLLAFGGRSYISARRGI